MVVATAMSCDKCYFAILKERFDMLLRKIFELVLKILKDLINNDKDRRAKFLTQAMVGGEVFYKIKSMSPFADMILLPVFMDILPQLKMDLQKFLQQLVEIKISRRMGVATPILSAFRSRIMILKYFCRFYISKEHLLYTVSIFEMLF